MHMWAPYKRILSILEGTCEGSLFDHPLIQWIVECALGCPGKYDPRQHSIHPPPRFVISFLISSVIFRARGLTHSNSFEERKGLGTDSGPVSLQRCTHCS